MCNHEFEKGEKVLVFDSDSVWKGIITNIYYIDWLDEGPWFYTIGTNKYLAECYLKHLPHKDFLI
jgi:hypothetical protein